jgi:hypothetical protein
MPSVGSAPQPFGPPRGAPGGHATQARHCLGGPGDAGAGSAPRSSHGGVSVAQHRQSA